MPTRPNPATTPRSPLASALTGPAVLVAVALAAGLTLLGASAASAQPLQLPSVPRPAAPVQTLAAPPAPDLATPAAPRKPVVPLPIPRPANLGSATAAVSAPAAAPVDRTVAPAPQAPHQVTPPQAPPVVQPVALDTSPQALLQRANASLNALGQLSADFVQTGGNGRRAEGKLFLQKPGRVRFEYLPPAQLEVIADGSSVVIRDRKLGTQDLYNIGQTPLKFLLRDRVDLARDTKVVDVSAAPDLVSVQLEDKATFGGTSRIELLFDPRSFALKQWVVTDPQGYQTAVALKNVDTQHRPDPALFLIDYSRNLPNMSSNR